MRNYRTTSPLKVVLAAFLIAGSFVAYDFFFTGNASAIDDGSIATSTTSASPIVAEVNTIQLDDSIFTNPTFESLQDFSVTLAPQPVGRDNPFAPLSSSAQTSAASQTTKATTKVTTKK